MSRDKKPTKPQPKPEQPVDPRPDGYWESHGGRPVEDTDVIWKRGESVTPDDDPA